MISLPLGSGVYFVVGHGGDKNTQITHGSSLFHESDRTSLEDLRDRGGIIRDKKDDGRIVG
jgi:hypothetical protein